MKDNLKTRKRLLAELTSARQEIGSLRDEINQRELEMASLLTASRSVSEFQNFRDAAHTIFSIAKDLIGATSGYVALLSDDGSENEVLFLDAGDLPCTVDPTLPMPIRGLRAEAYRDGRIAFENDFLRSEWQKFMPDGHVDLANVLFAPMIIEERVVGIMGLANKPGGFDDNDLRLATVFGDLAAVALSNDYTYESLEKSEERFRSVTQSANDAIISANADGKIVSWNKGARLIFGYEEAEVLGEDLALLMPLRYRDDHARSMRQYLETGIPRVMGRTVEMHGIRKDGDEFPLELSLSSWRTNDGVFFTGIIRDITTRRRNENLSQTLNSINAAINATLAIDDIAATALDGACRVLGAGCAFMAIPQGDLWVIGHWYGLAETLSGTALTGEEAAIMARALTKKEPMWTGAVDPPIQIETLATMDASSLLLVPLQSGEEDLGVLVFGCPQTAGGYSAAEIDFAAKLSTSVALSLKNAALYKNELESRNTCQNYANQLAVLHKVGLSLNREIDKYKLLRTVLSAASELTSAGVGVMTLVEGGKTIVVASYYAPWNQQECAITGDISHLHQRITLLIGDMDAVRLNDLSGLDRLPEGHVDLRGLIIGVIRDTMGRMKGFFMLSNKVDEADFTSEDEEIISLLAAQSSVALVSAENFEREHVVAETLQDSLLPEAPKRDDIDVGLLYQSAGPLGKIGGDFYDFVELDDDRIAVVVGDVCGKGLTAATYTAMIKYMLRAYLGEGMLPGDCLTRLNRSIHNQVSIEKFVTIGVSLIDIRNATISYSSAGHPPPAIRQNGRTKPLFAQPAVPLGVIADHKFLSAQIPVAGADLMVMYTDGLIEARPDDSEPFGVERVMDLLERFHSLPAQKLAQSLIDAAIAYAGGALRDDIALLVVKFPQG